MVFKKRLVTKIGNLIVTKLGDSKTYRLFLKDEEDAMNLYNSLSVLEPDNDMEYFISLCEAVSAGEEVKEIAQEQQKVAAKLKSLEEISDICPELYLKNNKVYHKTVSQLSLPERLVDEFFERHARKEPIEPLVNFWMFAACNPDPKAREGLFRFIMDMNLVLTDDGMFVAYRNVVDINQVNVDLVKEVSAAAIKCAEKRWSTVNRHLHVINYEYLIPVSDFDDDEKEYESGQVYIIAPSDDTIKELRRRAYKKVFSEEEGPECEYEDFMVLDYQDLGSIASLQKELGSMQEEAGIRFTDDRTKSMKIQIGVPVSMVRSECDSDENVSCSRGLHLGSESFMKQSYFGNTPVICLVNPRNVVAVPLDYGNSYKMRCCEYLPIGFTEYDENGNIKPLKSKTLSNISKDYALSDIIDLKELMAISEFKEIVEHQILPANVSIVNIGAALSRIRKDIEGRVTNV